MSNAECLTVCWKVLLLSAVCVQYREVMGLQLQKGKFGLEWRKHFLPQRTKLLNRGDYNTLPSEVSQGTHNPSSKHLLTPHRMARRTRQIHRASCSPTINWELLKKEVKKSETCPAIRAQGRHIGSVTATFKFKQNPEGLHQDGGTLEGSWSLLGGPQSLPILTLSFGMAVLCLQARSSTSRKDCTSESPKFAWGNIAQKNLTSSTLTPWTNLQSSASPGGELSIPALRAADNFLPTPFPQKS